MVSQEPSCSKRVRPLPAGGGRALHEQAPPDAQLSAQDSNAHLRDLDLAALRHADAERALAADGPGEVLLVVQLVRIAARDLVVAADDAGRDRVAVAGLERVVAR